MNEDTNNEVIDSTTDAEQTVDTESTEVVTEETSTQEEETVDVARLQETNKKLFERAKKAEAELKKLKVPPTAKPVTKETSQPSNVEETVLLAQGMSEDLLATLKKVAAVNGTSLIKAQNDPIFVAIKEKNEKETISKKANVGVSRGSGGVKAKKDFNTPGLTQAEHEALFKERMGM